MVFSLAWGFRMLLILWVWVHLSVLALALDVVYHGGLD
jgi:hypothetical protein